LYFRAIWIFGVGHIIIKLLSVYNGLIIFGKYETCDPLHDGKITKFDQIFPYYVMDVARAIPGLPGMFVVGVFSAALSSVSSLLNILSGTAYDDFVKPFFPKASDQKASTIMKVIVMVVGSICLVMVLVVEKLGSVFSIGITMSSITYGTLLGLFTLGMISPAANSKGALAGSIVSLLVVGFIATGGNIAIYQEKLKYPTLPFRIDGCGISNETLPTNITTYIANNDGDPESVYWFFRISFMYYSLIGTVISMVVGYLVSVLFPDEDHYVDDKLLAPFMRQFNPKRPMGEKSVDIHNVITSTDIHLFEQEMKMLKEEKEPS
jgi:solute carrier family 5 (sodium-coupled monocarboxylate transporter), member 8/12